MEPRTTAVKTSSEDVGGRASHLLYVGMALAAVACLLVAGVHFFIWGYGMDLPCWACLVYPVGMILVPAVVIMAGRALVKERSRMSAGQWVARIGLLGLLLLGVLFFVSGYDWCLMDLGIRVHVRRTGGIEQLQSWALDLVDRPEAEVLLDPDGQHSYLVREEVLSEQVKAISRDVFIRSTPEGRRVVVRVGGGGFLEFDWGIIVTSPEVTIRDDQKRLRRWRNGMWGYVGKGL